MKDSLKPGIANEKTIVTTPDMGISHMGEGNSVLSTPAMIGLMEHTALESCVPHLDANEQTVGTMVHVWHRAAIPTGQPVTIRTRLIEQDRRKLLFEVACVAGDKIIGDGTHERFVVDMSKFKQ
jgi:predicted thioesterase